MIDRKQLDAMIIKARDHGKVTVTYNRDGRPVLIKVSGIVGVGSEPMGPIGFSEAMHRISLGVGMNGRLQERTLP